MPFQKGKSGNPSGRPKKSYATAEKLREGLESDLPKIIETLKQMALSGDVQAAKLLLDRVLPPLKPVQQAQPVAAGSDLLTQGQSIIVAMQKGELSPEAAQTMLSALLSQTKVIEHQDFDSRLKALEDQQR